MQVEREGQAHGTAGKKKAVFPGEIGQEHRFFFSGG